MAIDNIMNHTDILSIITCAGLGAAIILVAYMWHIQARAKQRRLALLEETEQKKRDQAMEAWRNAVSIDME